MKVEVDRAAGRYTIERELGRVGMATVYRAHGGARARRRRGRVDGVRGCEDPTRKLCDEMGIASEVPLETPTDHLLKVWVSASRRSRCTVSLEGG
jgi:predicted RecB family endonuclease